MNHNKKGFTGKGFLFDFLYSTIKTKAAFNKTATIKPSITIVPSTACKGIIAFTLPFLRILNSTNLITTEIMKQILQMKTILEKKRKSFYYELRMMNLKFGI